MGQAPSALSRVRIASQRSAFGVLLASGPCFRDPADSGAFAPSPRPFRGRDFERTGFRQPGRGLHSSHRRQRAIIRADGDPKPPRRAAANHARRRRPLPVLFAPRERPRLGMASRNIVSMREMSRFFGFVIPGRCEASSPESRATFTGFAVSPRFRIALTRVRNEEARRAAGYAA
jgi:hypothetical protein